MQAPRETPSRDTSSGSLPMIVIYRNGERQVISGWREWLFWLAAAAVIVVLGCLALGFALTLFTVAIFALPIALVLALLSGLFRSNR